MRCTRLLTVLLTVSLAISSCGGDDASSSELNIAMVEFAFEPPDIAVSAGSEITVTVDNIGSIPHEWVVLRDGVRIEDEDEIPEDDALFQSDFVFFEVHLEAGMSETATFTAPETPGTYQIICALPGHLSAGMVGELEVGDS